MTNTTNPKVPALPNRAHRLNTFVTAAAPIAAQYNYPLEVIVAIWAVESSWGAKETAPNNYFGITWPSSTAPIGTRPWLRRTREVLTSARLRQHLDAGLLVLHEPFVNTWALRPWDVSRNFCGYPTLQDGITHLLRLLTTGLYSPAFANYRRDRSVQNLIFHTANHYATDPNWGPLVYRISQQNNVQMAVKAAHKDSQK